MCDIQGLKKIQLRQHTLNVTGRVNVCTQHHCSILRKLLLTRSAWNKIFHTNISYFFETFGDCFADERCEITMKSICIIYPFPLKILN
jgi:hypothetical protein